MIVQLVDIRLCNASVWSQKNLRSNIEFAKRDYKVHVQVEEAKINDVTVNHTTRLCNTMENFNAQLTLRGLNTIT